MKTGTICVLKSLRDIFDLAGKHNIKLRQFILSDILNKKITKAKSGINRVETVLFEMAGITDKGYCYAEQRNCLKEWIDNL